MPWLCFDGSSLLDTDGRFRIEAVREAVAARLDLVPRFRQLLYVPPRRLGVPLWVDAANFELSDHIAELRLPAPGDETQLLVDQQDVTPLGLARQAIEMSGDQPPLDAALQRVLRGLKV